MGGAEKLMAPSDENRGFRVYVCAVCWEETAHETVTPSAKGGNTMTCFRVRGLVFRAWSPRVEGSRFKG